MCRPVHKHFICFCPNRNAPTCPHHTYLRNHAEFIVMDDGKLTDENGWFYRLRDQGQSYRGWQPYAAEWEHCIYYKLANRDELTREVTLGKELLCQNPSQSEPIIKHKTGVCVDCTECEKIAKRAKEETQKKIAELKKKGMK
ncbi:hypothetical protein QBC44DRAFT_310313 [Cladorrhinum sp. PSN332]|nr:hypothetical protein QBC44DRAFT_310313 [Cladorrhinum sp. PSN332]